MTATGEEPVSLSQFKSWSDQSSSAGGYRLDILRVPSTAGVGSAAFPGVSVRAAQTGVGFIVALAGAGSTPDFLSVVSFEAQTSISSMGLYVSGLQTSLANAQTWVGPCRAASITSLLRVTGTPTMSGSDVLISFTISSSTSGTGIATINSMFDLR